MTHGTTATLALLMLLLAGCGTPTSDPPTTTPASSSMGTTTPPASTLQTIVVTPFDTRHYRIDERPENATVRVFHTPEQRADFLTHCGPGGPGVGRNSGEEWYSFMVWNRTGLVHYEQHPIYPTSKYPIFDRSYVLPQDPPYLIWTGGTCSGLVSIQLNTPHWKRMVTGRGEGNEDRPGAIDEHSTHTVEVRIPPGQLEGNGYLTTGSGSLFWGELQPKSGGWTMEGQSLGDAYLYAPDQTDGGDWFIHSWFDLVDSGWEGVRGETAMPGTYRYHVKLMAPAATETIWRGRVLSISFQEDELARQGFQVPFRLYDDHTAR